MELEVGIEVDFQIILWKGLGKYVSRHFEQCAHRNSLF